ncbi:hypothetical protein [Streptomyces sp. NPDC091215]|uniref:hypothetical protein n=1 Tax=Streptomyces sp. NPDC091215 TaxID=3155192 RepID=UPI00342F6E2E
MSTNPLAVGTPAATLTVPGRLLAVLTDAADSAMREAIPHLYTPEAARKFAETMAALLIAEQQTAGGAR